jgi:peptidyl-prolyl cis-trans isomerase B (cyclophilin B)
VPSSKERERKLARAKIERQQARRAQKIRAQRQVQARIGAALAILVVLAGIGWATNWYGLKSSSSTANAECTWTKTSNSTDLKNVGTPPTTGIPMSGTAPLTITTNQGVIHGSLDVTQAPCTVASFNYLASKGFFTNTKCHRLTTAGLYVLQCGDPSGTGQGGPTYTIPDENIPIAGAAPADGSSASAASTVVYAAGTIAVANTGTANSGGSQFFLVYKDSTLPDSYSVMGTMDKASVAVVNKVAAGGVGTGGTSATDGPPKLTTTIQSFVIGKPVAAASPSPAAPSLAPSTSTSPAPPVPSTTAS